jgi:hypothetical protein
MSDQRFQTNLIWNQGQILSLVKGVWRDWRYGGALSLDLAA